MTMTCLQTPQLIASVVAKQDTRAEEEVQISTTAGMNINDI